MNLEEITKALNFDEIDDDMFAELFDEAQIEKHFSYDNTILNPLDVLPNDYLWYLQNYGSRTVRSMEFKVRIDNDALGIKAFSGLASPANVNQAYRYLTCTGSYAYRLEDEKVLPLETKYLPITSEQDGQVTLLDFKDNIGSVWQCLAKFEREKFNLVATPIFVAGSFTEFLALIEPSYSSSYFEESLLSNAYKRIDNSFDIWKKNAKTAKELFYEKLIAYEKDNTSDFTQVKDLNEFIALIKENPNKISVNKPRSVELYYVNNFKVSDIGFEEEIELCNLHNNDFDNKHIIKRVQPTAMPLKQLTNNPNYIGTDHHFYKTTITSTINNMRSEEDFVFYKDPQTGLLSFVRIIELRVEDLNIKDIGVFEYDLYWASKKTLKIKWSRIPATIRLHDDTENFTEEYFDFIRATLDDDSLKETLEAFIFDHYQNIDYAEFLEMNEIDADYFEGHYPDVSTPEKIWNVLGETFVIHFIDNTTFHVTFDYLPDEEHGLSLVVNSNVITLNH